MLKQENEVILTEGKIDLGLTAPSAILMEASTGTVIYEKNADTILSPASITKIMTLILIFDAISDGKINLTDEVTTSAYAKSMGGSQVFLEEGEKQTVETLIKCIVVASGNDACVAMAEYIAGSESEFVRQMNERAVGLEMKNTHFEDCSGLSDSDSHHTSARDVALMSRELLTKYPQITTYSTIWMENITHVTAQGSKEFGLSSTNKMLKMNTSFTTTGLKTGSTSKAKYCFAGTAQKDGVELIAVVMACPNYKDRFSEAVTMLNYGYANCKLYRDTELPILPEAIVKNGVEASVGLTYSGEFSYLSTTGENFAEIEKNLIVNELEAPVQEGQEAGYLEYSLNGKVIGQVPIITLKAVEEAGYRDYLWKMLKQWLL
ncbi:MAG: D-alanyl-D-alanine carboxypeptidase family protein [Lachnospiraceae bacterium]